MNTITPALEILCREGMRLDEPVKLRKAIKEIRRDARRFNWDDDRMESMPPEWQWRVCCARLQMGILDWRGWDFRNPRGGHDPFEIRKIDLGLPIYPAQKDCREPERVKRLLVYSEQGIGDQLMFARAIPYLRDFADEICIEVEPRLAPIFQRTFPDMMVHPLKDLRDASWVEKGYFERKVLMGDVCARFLREKPFEDFSMSADPVKVREWKSYKCRTGFSFHGRQADLPLENFEDGFVNLQYGEHEVPERFLTPPIDLTNDLEDVFGILANLDRVVTVPNTLAHMAGVLNVPTDVIMTPGRGEVHNGINYRWGMHGDMTMPWHPSITIHRNWTQYDKRRLPSAASGKTRQR